MLRHGSCFRAFLWALPLFFLFIAFCVFYGLARIVAEGGLGFARAQMTAQPFVIHAVGTEAVTPQWIGKSGHDV